MCRPMRRAVAAPSKHDRDGPRRNIHSRSRTPTAAGADADSSAKDGDQRARPPIPAPPPRFLPRKHVAKATASPLLPVQRCMRRLCLDDGFSLSLSLLSLSLSTHFSLPPLLSSPFPFSLLTFLTHSLAPTLTARSLPRIPTIYLSQLAGACVVGYLPLPFFSNRFIISRPPF